MKLCWFVLLVLLLPGCGMGWALGVWVNDNVADPVDARFDTGDTDDEADVDVDTDTDTDADCWGDAAVVIEAARINCDEWGYFGDVLAVGLPSGAELHIAHSTQTDGVVELGHPFRPTEPVSSAPDSDTRGYDDDLGGCWSNPYIELVTVSSGDVVPGETTQFPCAVYDSLSFSVGVFDSAGALADCGSGGQDPSGSYGGWDFGACGLL